MKTLAYQFENDNILSINSNSREFLSVAHLFGSCLSDFEKEDMPAPISFSIDIDPNTLRLMSVKWKDVGGIDNFKTFFNGLNDLKFVHGLIDKCRVTFRNNGIYDDIVSLLTDNFGGYCQPIISEKDKRDIEAIFVGTDGDHLTTFEVQMYDREKPIVLNDCFFESDVVDLLVNKYEIA